MTSWTITQPQHLRFDGSNNDGSNNDGSNNDGDSDGGVGDGRVLRLDVRLNAGRLSVVGTGGPPRVEIGKMSETPIEVDLTDGVLSVRHARVRTWPGLLEPLWWWLQGKDKFSSDVSIAVPYDTPGAVWVGTGSIVVSTLHADLSADCVSGRITLLGVDGALRAKVVSGPIEALGCAGDIDLETVSGEITVADTAATRLRAKTVSGALTADLDNPPDDCEIKLDTISGEITIRVRDDSDLAVSLNAAHGRVTSDFPNMSALGTWGASATGVIGGGAGKGRLRASAVGGNIALLRRPNDPDFGRTDAS